MDAFSAAPARSRSRKSADAGSAEAGSNLPEAEKLAAQRAEDPDQLRTLIDSFSDCIWQIDETAAFSNVSPGVRTLLGYDPAELIGKSPFDLMPAAQAERARGVFRDIAAGREPFYGLESEALHKDGRRLVLEASGIPIFGKDGGLQGYYGMVRDITARKRAEETVRLQASQYATMLATTADGFWRFDADGRLLDVNDAYCRMSGYTRAQLLRMGVQDLEAIETPAETAQHIERVKKSGFERFESSHRRKDGSIFDVEVSVSWWAEQAQFLLYCRDISARKQVREKIREHEELFRGLVEQEIAGIFILGPDASIVYVNPRFAAMLGYLPTEIIGRPLHEFIATADMPQVGEAFTSLISGKKNSIQMELRVVRKDGALVDMLAQGRSASYQGGPAVMGVALDITERKRAVEDLRASHAMLTATERIAGIGGWEWDIPRDRLTWSEELYRMLGRTPGKLPTVADFLASVHPEDAGCVQEAITASLTGGVPYDLQFRIVLPDQSERIIHGRGEVMRDSSGKAVKMAGTAQDITERKKTERELAFHTAVLATEHELSPDGILVVDRRRRIVSFNRRLVDMMQIPAGLVEARDDRPVLEYATRHVADPRAFLARVRHLYAHPEEKGFEHVVLKDGRTFDRYTAPMRTPDGDYLGRVWFFREITGQLDAQRKLERINRTLLTLSAGNEVLVRTTSEPELLEEMCRVAVEKGGYRFAWIGFAENDDAKSVRPVAWFGEKVEFEKLTSISWDGGERGRGSVGAAIRTGEVQINQDIETNPAMAPWREAFLAAGYRASVSLPLKNRLGTFGAFAIYAGEPNAFREDEVKLLIELADDLSYGINSLRDRVAREESVQRLRKSLDATVQAIASTLEMRDPYTAGHQRGVAELAVAIGREMGVSEDEIQGIYLAGVIHDIGKINVPAEILSKPGKLTPLEFQIIQTHAQAGYDIMKGVDFPWPVAEIVLQHHERRDGSGYPNGLKDGQILLGAKILAVADVVEAMTSRRPYRAALGLDAALAEVERGRGRIYDANAVDACIALFKTGRFEFRHPENEANVQPQPA
jgi:PAS domain S-box-containing protein